MYDTRVTSETCEVWQAWFWVLLTFSSSRLAWFLQSSLHWHHGRESGYCSCMHPKKRPCNFREALIGLNWVSPVVGYLVTVLFVIVHNEATYSYSLLSIITKLIRQGGTYFKDPYSPPPPQDIVLISTRPMSSVLNRELCIKNNLTNSINNRSTSTCKITITFILIFILIILSLYD